LPPADEQLLAYVRVVAAVTTLALLAYAVVVERDAATLGVLVGALALWLGLASYEALRR
jgi:hypothetical protein